MCACVFSWIPSWWDPSFPSQISVATYQPSPRSRCHWWWPKTCSESSISALFLVLRTKQKNTTTCESIPYHENKNNEDDKGCKVNRPKHWISLLNLWVVKVSQDDSELGKPVRTRKHVKLLLFQPEKLICLKCCWICSTADLLLHAGLECAEIIDLRSKHQVGELSVRQEDDEEHDCKPHEVLGAAGHGAGQLAHGFVDVDELKQLVEVRNRL